jgi:hypothetical protein
MKTTLKSGGRLYGLNKDGEIYTKEGNKDWKELPPSHRIKKKIVQIAVNDIGNISVLSDDGHIYSKRSVEFGQWLEISDNDNKNFKNIYVGHTKERFIILGVNSSDNIYYREGGQWKQIQGKLKNISVAADGRIWGVNSKGETWTRATKKGVSQHWKQILGRQLEQISVGPGERVWGVNSAGDIYTRVGLFEDWLYIKGKLKQIYVSRSGRVWGVDSENHIYTRDGLDGNWQRIEGEMTYVTQA